MTNTTDHDPHASEAGMTLAVHSIEQYEPEGSYYPLVLKSDRGDIQLRYYPSEVPDSKKAALFVGGAGGGWDTPVKGHLYPGLCEMLPKLGIACLRVQYRHPGVLGESILDTLAGTAFLESQEIEAVALVGHSFGGAVVIQAAAHDPIVRTVLPLSTQSFGAEPVRILSPDCSVFLYHGGADEVLPPECSERVFKMAGEPKKMIIHETARHGLDEAATEIFPLVTDWIDNELGRALLEGEDDSQ